MATVRRHYSVLHFYAVTNLTSKYVLIFLIEMTASAIAREVIEDILDVIFPAEQAAAGILTVLLDNVDITIKSRGTNTDPF
jgi:hypothetical protein